MFDRAESLACESGDGVVFAPSGKRTGGPTWDEIDRQLRAIAVRRAGLDLEEARWLVVARREGLHRHFGFARLEEYMERVLGYGPHAAAERLRVAEAMIDLPAMRAALEAGEINYSAVRELSRVVDAKTESAWIEAARGRTLREIEPMVAGRRKGDLPGTPAAPGARRHVVRFEVAGETLALLREARIALADATGELIDDDMLVRAMCRAVLDDGGDASRGDGGEADRGDGRDTGRGGSGNGGARTRARHQIALTICEACERGWQDGGGVPIEVEADVIARARCDAQHIGRVGAAVPARATQDIPPAVRRLVWRRDHGRCVVPGCRSARFLDLHHVQPRAEGGDHSPDNLCILCFAHHQAVHDHRLVIRGRVSTGLTFTHEDGRGYGTPPPGSIVPPARTETSAIDDAVAALRVAGFTAGQARQAVGRAASHVGSGASLESLIRTALQELLRGHG